MESILEMQLYLAMVVLSRLEDWEVRHEAIHPDKRDATTDAVKKWRALEVSRAAQRKSDAQLEMIPYVMPEGSGR